MFTTKKLFRRLFIFLLLCGIWTTVTSATQDRNYSVSWNVPPSVVSSSEAVYLCVYYTDHGENLGDFSKMIRVFRAEAKDGKGTFSMTVTLFAPVYFVARFECPSSGFYGEYSPPSNHDELQDTAPVAVFTIKREN